MTKKDENQKDSPKSEEKDLSEYEESYDGDWEEEEKGEEINYDEYELPEGFVPPEKREEEEESKTPTWIQKILNVFYEMTNVDRLYWSKILIGIIAGVIMGLAGAKTGWWLFLVVGLYAAITAGGYFLFDLKGEIDWKKAIFSGFFPYIALITLFWVLMFTTLYAPSMTDWQDLLIETITVNETDTTYTTVITNTTSAAGIPFIPIILTILGTLGLLEILLRKQRKKK